MCVAAGLVGGAVASAGIGAMASSDAASTQADAADRAGQISQAQYEQTREDLAPYRNIGTTAINQLMQSLGYRQPASNSDTWEKNPDSILNQQFNYADFAAPTAEQARQAPGYQFTLDQGLKAAQNSASARGLGVSGAALKGAETFASGLADATYGDTFNRALQSYTANRNNAASNFATNYSSASDAVNRLLGITGLGENAAAQTGNAGAQAANSVSNAITSAGNASAAGAVGVGNAISGGINSAMNGLVLNQLLPSGTMTNGTSMYGSRGALTTSDFSNPAGW